jgi:hypothetical protein
VVECAIFDVRHALLRDLREDVVLVVKWIAGLHNTSDLLTKNLSGPLRERHAAVYRGQGEYMQYDQKGGLSEFELARGKGVGMPIKC